AWRSLPIDPRCDSTLSRTASVTNPRRDAISMHVSSSACDPSAMPTWFAYRRASKLTGQSVQFFPRKVAGLSVEELDEVHRDLPRLEFPVRGIGTHAIRSSSFDACAFVPLTR